ncbi:unnamed protein product, partial [Ilex paraguariensis]
EALGGGRDAMGNVKGLGKTSLTKGGASEDKGDASGRLGGSSGYFGGTLDHAFVGDSSLSVGWLGAGIAGVIDGGETADMDMGGDEGRRCTGGTLRAKGDANVDLGSATSAIEAGLYSGPEQAVGDAEA